MMVHPDDQDDEETECEGDVRGPECKEPYPETAGKTGLWNANPEYEQRNRDREDTVAKRLNPAGSLTVHMATALLDVGEGGEAET